MGKDGKEDGDKNAVGIYAPAYLIVLVYSYICIHFNDDYARMNIKNTKTYLIPTILASMQSNVSSLHTIDHSMLWLQLVCCMPL